MEPRLWTLNEDEAVKKLYEEGKTFEEIAQRLGRSSSSIKVRVQRNLKVKRNRKPKIDLTGQKFGQLEVIGMVKNNLGWFVAKCKCSCGECVEVEVFPLLKGQRKTCGCRKGIIKMTGEANPLFTGYKEIRGSFWGEISSRAKRIEGGMKISIEEAWQLYLSQEKKCALSGLPIFFGPGRLKCTASLDRINSKEGYVLGNVQWVHKVVNFMKGIFDQTLFINFCALIATKQHLLMNEEQILEQAMFCRSQELKSQLLEGTGEAEPSYARKWKAKHRKDNEGRFTKEGANDNTTNN